MVKNDSGIQLARAYKEECQDCPIILGNTDEENDVSLQSYIELSQIVSPHYYCF